MMKKWAALLLIVALVAGLFPAPETASAASAALYVNTDSETQGNWVGVYGADGYVLPFFASNRTNGRDDPLADAVAELPDYVNSYTRQGDNYWAGNPNDLRALQTPDGSARKKLEVYSGTSFTYTFNLNDEEPHLFTVYTTDFSNQETITERFEILNMSNNVLESVDVHTINGGKYITFQVQGSFKFRATKVAGNRAYAQGYFFDEPVPNTTSGLTAANLPGRSVELQWTDSSSAETAILRKRTSEASFQRIAVTASGVTTYIDEDLTPGEQYVYALQSVAGRLHSLPSAEESVTIPLYFNTTLQFQETALVVDEPGQTVALSVYYSDEHGNPLAGQPVTFELAGDYVGTHIDAELGVVDTGVDGIASTSYTPLFAGAFTVKAAVPPDDDRLLNAASAETTLNVNNKAWLAAPLLMRVTDAVKPGMLFSVSGHAMIASDWGDVQVAIEPLSSAGVVPSPGATEPDIVQLDELRGQFIQLIMPDTATPGLYRLWVSNEHGWSEPITLNAPRPLFISEYEVFDGLSIDLSGRNLQADEFGGSDETQVRLNGGAGGLFQVDVVELTPYSLRFAVEDVPLGEYEVEVSNDGGLSWHGLQSGQTLTVLPQGDDPLGLGVAWAANFAWDQVFDVTAYGAVADDDGDDTAAIAAAISAAKTAGGGVVYLPAGEFHATAVQLPSRIVLMGEGPEETLLYHTGGNANFIRAVGDGKTEGRTGVARLGIRASNDEMYPDAFIWLGQDWGTAVNDLNLRTASEIFAFEISIDYPVLDPVVTTGGSGRGQGMLVIGDERFLYKNNRAVGWAAQYNRIYVNRYAYSSDNYVEYAFSQMPITADYTFIRDNEFVLRGEANIEMHGIGIRANSHVENNLVLTTGADEKTTYHNDGESIFAEMPGGYFATGDVLGATPDTVTLAPVLSLAQPDPLLRNGRLSVLIVDGTGLGQYREVEFASGTTYSLAEEWDVVPDRTSKFTLIAPNDNITIYRNSTIDGQRGVWLYGNVIDAVVADNELINTDGIYVAATAVVGSNRYTPTYFVNVKGNQLLGTPGEGHASGIITVSQRNGVNGRYYASGIYGIEVRDNYLYGSQTPVSTPRHQKFSGIVSSAATLSSDSSPVFTPEDRDNLNVIMENNRMENMSDGIVLMSGLYGHTAKGNHYDDVAREIYERYGAGTSRIQVLPDGFADVRAPFWPALAKLETVLVDDDTALLSWDHAIDMVGVTEYQVYVNGSPLDVVDAVDNTYEAGLLLPGTVYSFAVAARDAAGNESYVQLKARIQTTGEPVDEEEEPEEEEPGGSPGGDGQNGGSGGGQQGNDSSGANPDDVTADQPQLQLDGAVAIGIKSMKDESTGVALATVDEETLAAALKLAEADSEGVKRVRIHLSEATGAAGYAIDLPTAIGCATDPGSGDGAYRLDVLTAYANVALPCEALQAGADGGEATLRMIVSDAGSLENSAGLAASGAEVVEDKARLAVSSAGTLEEKARLMASSAGALEEKARLMASSTGAVGDSFRVVADSASPGGSAAKPAVQVAVYAGNKLFAGLADMKLAVTIPYEPSAVEHAAPGNIVVWHMDGGERTVVLSGRYDAAAGGVVYKMERSGIYAVGYERISYDDLGGFGWARQFVEALSARGVVHGTAPGVFTPEASIKRGDFILLLARILELEGATGEAFVDVDSSDYYYEAISAARAHGIVVGGGDNTFRPEDAVTRQDMIVMAARAMRHAGMLPSAGGTGGDNAGWHAFEDSDQVADYARDDVASLIAIGIVQGSDGKLAPARLMSRAEAAALVYRIVELL